MEPMMAYGGNGVMNVVMGIAYAARRDAFRGIGTSGGVSYSFDVAEVPVVRLVPDEATHNVAIALEQVVIAVGGGVVELSRVVRMQATGTLALRERALSLTGLRVTTDAAGVVDRVVARLVDSRIVPRIGAALASVPVPQLADVFGSGLSAELRTCRVMRGPALEVGAGIVGVRDVPAADAPSAADIASLDDGPAGSARVIAMVSGGVVNALLEGLARPPSLDFDRRGRAGSFGGGLRGAVSATAPVLAVSGGRGRAGTALSFDSLTAGIRIPIKGWTWLPLRAPTANVVIEHALSASGRRGALTLTGVESIEVSLAWPGALRPVEAVARGLLGAVLARSRGRIAAAVAGRTFAIFELPETLPGTSVAAGLDFEPGGLRYERSSIRAVVRIRA